MTEKDLSNKTDEQLALLARDGNDAAEELLLTKYKETVLHRAGLYFIAGGDRDDLVQEGMIGLVKAIRAYSSDFGASFKTFAEVCINRQILSAVRSALRSKHRLLNEAVSLDQAGEDGDSSGSLAETLTAGSSSDPEASLIFSELFKDLTGPGNAAFSDFEQSVLKHLAEGRTYREIAVLTGKTPKQTDNAIQRIKRKLKKILETGA